MPAIKTATLPTGVGGSGPTLWEHIMFGSRYLHDPSIEPGLYSLRFRCVRIIDHFPEQFRQITDPNVVREAVQTFEEFPPTEQDLLGVRGGKIRHGAGGEWSYRIAAPPAASLATIVGGALSSRIAASFKPMPLDEADIRLAFAWAEQDPGSDRRPWGESGVAGTRAWETEKPSEAHALARMLSARAAEKAVQRFYSVSHGVPPAEIHDISRLQLAEDPGEVGWKSHDLRFPRLEPAAIDVKNSRTSLNSPQRYVSHCVRHKKDPYGVPVTVAGVLSNYLRVSELLHPEHADRPTQILVLGMTEKRKLDGLVERYREHLDVDFRRAGEQTSKHFLPPWMFDYPDIVYAGQDQTLASLPKCRLYEPGLWKDSGLNPAPVFLACREDLKKLHAPGLTSRQWECYDHLRQLREGGRFLLPDLYLSVLTWFLRDLTAVRTGRAAANSLIDEYAAVLFAKRVQLNFEVTDAGPPNSGDPGTTFPLGIYDPLRTIFNLLCSLRVLLRHADLDRVGSMALFRLKGPNILQGRTRGGPWRTLLAYCGGRDPMWNNAPCGRTPLVAGPFAWCERCGFLVCDRCRTCRERCTGTSERRVRVKEGGATDGSVGVV